MDSSKISLSDLQKWTDLPRLVNDLEKETWFVSFGNEPVGVGIFDENQNTCLLAIVGSNDADQRTIGKLKTSDKEEEQLILHGLQIAYVAYLRSIKGDTIS